jgi:transcription antitermination factor NusG
MILANKGFEVFLPTYETVRRWTDRNKRLTLPLFPCYLFFADESDRRIQILSTPGVHSIVRAGSVPAIIPYSEIDGIRRMVEGPLGAEPHPFLHDGDRVRIKFGPLAGLEGILSRKKDALRLVLSVNLLGRSAAVEINSHEVERVAPAPQANFNSRLKPAVRSEFTTHARPMQSLPSGRAGS